MPIRNGLFSSESVSEGHPDKLADRISDAVLDEFLRLEPTARVACETLLADQCVVVAGEFRTRDPATFTQVRERAVSIVTRVLRDAGYRDGATGIDPDRCEIQVRFNRQTDDINQGVDRDDGVIGAGDQGLMFGYACRDTPELMPAPIVYAHRLVQKQAEVRRSGRLPWLGPDAKSQVTFRYQDGQPVAIEAVVLSTQHAADVDIDGGPPGRAARDHRPRHPCRTARCRLSRAHQPHGPLRHRRPQGRYGPHRPQDHRRHLRRRGAPRRRRLLGEGSLQGGPLGRVHGPLPRQAGGGEELGTRALVQLAYAIGVAEPVSFHVDAEGVDAKRAQEITAPRRGVRPHAGRDHPRAGPAASPSTTPPRPTGTSGGAISPFLGRWRRKRDATQGIG